jgi:transcriptional regulator with XRE-family HTH domain
MVMADAPEHFTISFRASQTGERDRKSNRQILDSWHPFSFKLLDTEMLNRALKLLRTYHQLTQVDLAKRLGISNSYLSEIESGNKAPTIDLLDKYAEIFKMPTSSILLFSESLTLDSTRGAKLRVVAADKILRLLEWFEEREEIHKSK